jgi:hypothetical protein
LALSLPTATLPFNDQTMLLVKVASAVKVPVISQIVLLIPPIAEPCLAKAGHGLVGVVGLVGLVGVVAPLPVFTTISPPPHPAINSAVEIALNFKILPKAIIFSVEAVDDLKN